MPLTVKRLAKLTTPGRYGDGAGLYLQVGKGDGRAWLLRYVVRGKERYMGLGPLHTFTLDEARQRARKARQLLRDGIDPLEAKTAERAAQVLQDAKRITFRDAAHKYFDQHETKWTNARHRQQFKSTMEMYVHPIIGKLPVAAVDTTLVLRIIEPIWNDKNQTAIRLRGRIEGVLDWATVRGYRTGENPARWQGHLAEVLPAKAKTAKAKHYAALPYAEAPAFIAQLASQQGIGPKALEFLILTACRSNEVLGARWSEIDLAAKLWIIPAERMKEHEEHRVPLSARALEILKTLPTEGDFVFIGSRPNKPLGKNTFLKLIKLMRLGVTGHGFRSTFRDWAGDLTSFPREVCEAALAHKVGNAVERDYRRGDALEKRRKLMEAWSAFVTTPLHDASITPIRRSA